MWVCVCVLFFHFDSAHFTFVYSNRSICVRSFTILLAFERDTFIYSFYSYEKILGQKRIRSLSLCLSLSFFLCFYLFSVVISTMIVWKRWLYGMRLMRWHCCAGTYITRSDNICNEQTIHWTVNTRSQSVPQSAISLDCSDCKFSHSFIHSLAVQRRSRRQCSLPGKQIFTPHPITVIIEQNICLT